MKGLTKTQRRLILSALILIPAILIAWRPTPAHDIREERLLALADTAEQNPQAMLEFKRLLAAGVDPNARQPGLTFQGRISAAVAHQNMGILWRTLPEGKSALDIACRATSMLGERRAWHSELRPATVQALVEAGADVNHKDYAGYTPLVYAFYDNKAPIARLMIEHGAKATPEIYGYIHPAPAFDPELVDLAIRAGASVAGLTAAGERPLSQALERGNVRLTAELLKHGAKVNLPDGNGLTPRMHAQMILGRKSTGYNVWATGMSNQFQIDAARLVLPAVGDQSRSVSHRNVPQR